MVGFLRRVMLCACLAVVATPELSALELPDPPGERVSIGSHRLHLQCLGSGRPTVVLEAGLGGTSLDWVLVHRRIARHARTCAYDRGGYAWSEPGPGQRTSDRLAGELYRLLKAAQVPGPYLLVGHSLGGVHAQVFAARYPQDTAGLVLVDSSNGRQLERLAQRLPPPSGQRRGRIVLQPRPRPPAAMPERFKALARRLVSTPNAHQALADELSGMRASLRQVTQTSAPISLPVVVISRGRRVSPPGARGDRLETVWGELQSDLVARHHPAVQFVAKNSGHHVPLEAPKTVLNGVRTALEYVRAARSKAGLAAAIWPEAVR